MIQSQQREGKWEIRFEGNLDTARCVGLRKEIEDLLAQANLPVVFDLKGVNFVASSFLAICTVIAQRTGPGNFGVIHVGPMVKKVFKISSLDNLFMID